MSPFEFRLEGTPPDVMPVVADLCAALLEGEDLAADGVSSAGNIHGSHVT